jgi:lipoprotein-anchoring transpeptidase ErfK/SrfK
MFATVKKISVCFFTTLMLISFFSFNVSASSIETSAESFKAPAGVTLTYRSRARKKKWEKYKKQGWISGVAAKKKRKLDAVSIKIKSSTPGTIKYRVHAYRKGWTAYKTNGKTAGRRGYVLDRIQIKLTGELAEKYDIYYRVHIHTSKGWLDWAKNGEAAGAKDYAYFFDAIQIVLTEKDAGKPGNVANVKAQRDVPIVTGDAAKEAMINKAQGYSSKTKYLVLCDTKNFFTGVFTGSQGNWKLVRFICVSVGKESTPTKKGSFTIKNKKKKFFSGAVRCKYCTRFVKAYYFHSLPYSWNGKYIVSSRLAQRCTHGCVRMELGDAKYIYRKVPTKSRVIVY